MKHLLKYDLKEILDKRKALTKMSLPYTLTLTNYTSKIESPLDTCNFIGEQKSNRFFAAWSKIKSDIKKSGIEPPYIGMEPLDYFYNNPEMEPGEYVRCIDINAAYPTAFLNLGYITQETFDYLQLLPKIDRLAACFSYQFLISVFVIRPSFPASIPLLLL